MVRVPTLLAVLALAGAFSADALAIGKVQVPGVQVALYRHGYYKGSIDGISGPLTKGAIRSFQKAKKLQPDGVVGPRTRSAFGRFGGPLFGTRMLARGNSGFDVSVLQFMLSRRGFPPPSMNSRFDLATERSVLGFQRRVGLSPDGVVGRQTRAALLRGRAPKSQSAARPAGRRHVVRRGETLSGIAAASGTTVTALARRNRLNPRRFLLVGTQLEVPARLASLPSSASKSEIVESLNRWAAEYGVSSDLVRALAWQESGFQNHVRSGAGAFGVMQVIPATWFFVERFLLGTPVPRTSDGNVRVGVAFLDHLLEEFRGDVELALAAYYEGPAAIRRDGPAGETRHFVANVLALRGRV